MSLSEGDVVVVLDQHLPDQGWWKGELRGQVGVFPNSFVELLPAEASEFFLLWQSFHSSTNVLFRRRLFICVAMRCAGSSSNGNSVEFLLIDCTALAAVVGRWVVGGWVVSCLTLVFISDFALRVDTESGRERFFLCT